MITLSPARKKELQCIVKAGISLLEIKTMMPELTVDALIVLDGLRVLEKRWFMLNGIDRYEYYKQLEEEKDEVKPNKAS